MNEFDIKAAEWDNNPIHWDRSRAIVEDMIKRIPLNKEMTALEYGAGTGIASFLLKDYLKEITLMDNSKTDLSTVLILPVIKVSMSKSYQARSKSWALKMSVTSNAILLIKKSQTLSQNHLQFS